MCIEIDDIMHMQGEQMFGIGRAADLLWIQFGDKVKVTNRKGVEVEKGQFALHVLCPWRFTHNNRVLLGSRDIYIPRNGIAEEDFDCTTSGMSAFDEKVPVLESMVPVKVIGLSVDAVGTVSIAFETGLKFEAFPDSACAKEFWRFINHKTGRHTVVFE